MSMTVKFHWSRQIIIVSVVFCIIALGIIPFILYLCGLGGSLYVCYLCMFSTLCGMASQTPRTLSITPEAITLKRIIGTTKIPLENIVSIEQIPADTMSSTRSMMGCFGFFGSWGAIDVPNRGKFYMYATELDNFIMVQNCTWRSYIFSCTEREAFIKQVLKYKNAQ